VTSNSNYLFKVIHWSGFQLQPNCLWTYTVKFHCYKSSSHGL